MTNVNRLGSVLFVFIIHSGPEFTRYRESILPDEKSQFLQNVLGQV